MPCPVDRFRLDDRPSSDRYAPGKRDATVRIDQRQGDDRTVRRTLIASDHGQINVSRYGSAGPLTHPGARSTATPSADPRYLVNLGTWKIEAQIFSSRGQISRRDGELSHFTRLRQIGGGN